jgi:LysM repeat protein
MQSTIVEGDDTVVTLAVRFDVTWEDIVRANHIKPPYALKVGQRILIPKHAMRHPSTDQSA